jgi:DNA-binding GntR family transcriptional regulator
MTEQEFRDRYDFTIATTRAALARLTQEQLIQAEPRRGYVIAQLTLRDVMEVFDARNIVEAGVAELAAENLTAESLAKIEAAAKTPRTANMRGPAFLASNRAFHMAVAHASGNARLVKMVERLLDESERVLHLGLIQFDESEKFYEEHQQLVELIGARKGREAAELSKRQIEGGKQLVLAAIRSSPQIMDLDLIRLKPLTAVDLSGTSARRPAAHQQARATRR